jgi:hypothetical protein
MGFLIFIVVVVILMFCLAGWLGLALYLAGNRSQKKAEENAPDILDRAFTGAEDVVFKINMESPKYETVVLGAKARGYRLANETNDTASGNAKTLIFERVQSA